MMRICSEARCCLYDARYLAKLGFPAQLGYSAQADDWVVCWVRLSD